MTGIISFLDSWLGTSLSQIILLFAGILLFFVIVSFRRARRMGFFYSLMGGLVGLLMVTFALEDDVAGFLNSLAQSFQNRLFLLSSILIVFIVMSFLWSITVLPEKAEGVYGGKKRFFDRLASVSPGTLIIVVVAAYAVFATGIMAPQAMVGDEVTHFYMMTTQVDTLPLPNFVAKIPTGWGYTETRAYHHPFLWHYLGAVIYRVSGGSFVAIQLYQTLFLVQLLTFAYLLASDRGGKEKRSAALYLLVLAALPLTLLFSVTFYQDIPMAAQVVAGFYFLRKRRWVIASFFMCFALGLKVTAILFFPSFFICLFVWELQRRRWYKTIVVLALSLVIIGGGVLLISESLHRYAGATFYPTQKLSRLVHTVEKKIKPAAPAVRSSEPKKVHRAVRKKEQGFMANFPGNLRIKKNYLIYGGATLWLFLLCGGIAAMRRRFVRSSGVPDREPTAWLWFVGGSYLVAVTCLLWKTPDARFFLPGLPFVLLPVAEAIATLPGRIWIVVLFASCSILQGGYVLAKTYHLRNVSDEIKEAISYLQENLKSPRKIFMYPEGNYRLFPAPHEWYMHYYLREFWRADNDERIAMLHKYKIGAIVVKKHLIAEVDPNITNLGVYPRSFIKDINRDSRFQKVFDNSGVTIYLTPPQAFTDGAINSANPLIRKSTPVQE